MVEIETKKKLSFYLEAGDRGQIDLKCREPNTKSWFIVRIINDGSLMLHKGIPRNIGLKVDERGCVIVHGYRACD